MQPRIKLINQFISIHSNFIVVSANQLYVDIVLFYIFCIVFLLSFGGVVLLCVLCCIAVVAFWISCVLSILYIIGSHAFNYSFIPKYAISTPSLHILTPMLHTVILSNIILPFAKQSSWKGNLGRKLGDRKRPKRLSEKFILCTSVTHLHQHLHLLASMNALSEKSKLCVTFCRI